MIFDARISVGVREDLLRWQKLNVTAFAVSGIASLPDVPGKDYIDGSGRVYLPMIKQPIMVFSAIGAQLHELHREAIAAGTPLSIYTEDLFSTPDDDANRGAVAAVLTEQLRLVGLALRAPKKIVNQLVRKLPLHA